MQASLPDGLHDDTLLEDLEDIRHDMLEAHRAWELATDEEDVPNIIQAGAKAAASKRVRKDELEILPTIIQEKFSPGCGGKGCSTGSARDFPVVWSSNTDRFELSVLREFCL